MKTATTVTFISILSGVIVMPGALSPAARPQGTATHPLVLLTIAPLPIPRGTGSPVNPIAIF